MFSPLAFGSLCTSIQQTSAQFYGIIDLVRFLGSLLLLFPLLRLRLWPWPAALDDLNDLDDDDGLDEDLFFFEELSFFPHGTQPEDSGVGGGLDLDLDLKDDDRDRAASSLLSHLSLLSLLLSPPLIDVGLLLACSFLPPCSVLSSRTVFSPP